MDRIADQVTQIESTIAKLKVDVDNILDAILNADGGNVSPSHGIYWRYLIEMLTKLVLDADDRFDAAATRSGEASLSRDRDATSPRPPPPRT